MGEKSKLLLNGVLPDRAERRRARAGLSWMELFLKVKDDES